MLHISIISPTAQLTDIFMKGLSTQWFSIIQSKFNVRSLPFLLWGVMDKIISIRLID